jgi:hypothetical protein
VLLRTETDKRRVKDMLGRVVVELQLLGRPNEVDERARWVCQVLDGG